MKQTLSTLLATSLLSFTACGAVVEATDSRDRAHETAELDGEHGLGTDDHTDPREQPSAHSYLFLDPPEIATTETSLQALGLDDPAGIMRLVLGTEARDVVEQRVVIKTNEAIAFDIDLSAPTGQFSRVLGTSAGTRSTSYHSYACVGADDPKCRSQVPDPVASNAMAGGALASGTWTIRVTNDSTEELVEQCSVDGMVAHCELPAGNELTAIRVIASISHVTDLYDSGVLGVYNLEQRPYVGRMHSTIQCWDWGTVNGAWSCLTRYEWMRATGIDRARITFNGASFSIASVASDGSSMIETRTLESTTWDAGDADLPGPTY